MWHYGRVTQPSVDLVERVGQAVGSLEPPIGVVGSPEVTIERDSDDELSVFVLFFVSGKAKSEQLLKYLRAVEAAASRAAPTMPTYVRFEPRRQRAVGGSS